MINATEARMLVDDFNNKALIDKALEQVETAARCGVRHIMVFYSNTSLTNIYKLEEQLQALGYNVNTDRFCETPGEIYDHVRISW